MMFCVPDLLRRLGADQREAVPRRRGIVVHAISGEARKFYIALGFDPCPAEAMTLVVTLRDVLATLESG